MRNLIVALFALLIGSVALAQPQPNSNCDSITIPGLSDQKIQEMRVACQQALLEASKRSMSATTTLTENLSDPNKMSEWGQVAQEWAKALGLAAKELGLAVDGFLGTDAGKLTAAVIIWHIAGEQLLGLVIGIPLLITTIWVGLRITRRWRINAIEYGERRFGLFRTVKSVTYHNEDSGYIMSGISLVVTIILATIICSAIIF